MAADMLPQFVKCSNFNATGYFFFLPAYFMCTDLIIRLLEMDLIYKKKTDE